MAPLTGDSSDRRAGVDHPSLSIYKHDGFMAVLNNASETGLRRLKLLLGPFALRDIDYDHQHADDLTGCVSQR